ncbi:DsbA family protein [Allorhizobium borbori]|uniref:Protein-disulfide isomerase n=1 Tax=Allorhizobium borbori TaxID=485907 RepID=A0A7W6P0A3_9HYPH|nr:DsbA family protein [Allorhizobium borbori]MBB4102233.1 protein-disulfide isomerase [Allorhizobium borbori]PZU23143.1 MAG: disulfide bond formation protein DsbA [Shinella sp.]
MLTRRQIIAAAPAAFAFAALGAGAAQALEISEKTVFFDPDAPVLGNPKGDVTVVEFFDYQCPYCKKNHPMIRDVVKADGNIRFLMKDWPILGDASVYAAQAALGAAQIGRYETAMEALMKFKGRLSPDSVKQTLVDAGLKMDDITAAVNKYNQKISGLLDRNYGQATAFEFVGTPSFVVGRTTYAGVLDDKMLKVAIAEARKKKAG